MIEDIAKIEFIDIDAPGTDIIGMEMRMTISLKKSYSPVLEKNMIIDNVKLLKNSLIKEARHLLRNEFKDEIILEWLFRNRHVTLTPEFIAQFSKEVSEKKKIQDEKREAERVNMKHRALKKLHETYLINTSFLEMNGVTTRAAMAGLDFTTTADKGTSILIKKTDGKYETEIKRPE